MKKLMNNAFKEVDALSRTLNDIYNIMLKEEKEDDSFKFKHLDLVTASGYTDPLLIVHRVKNVNGVDNVYFCFSANKNKLIFNLNGHSFLEREIQLYNELKPVEEWKFNKDDFVVVTSSGVEGKIIGSYKAYGNIKDKSNLYFYYIISPLKQKDKDVPEILTVEESDLKLMEPHYAEKKESKPPWRFNHLQVVRRISTNERMVVVYREWTEIKREKLYFCLPINLHGVPTTSTCQLLREEELIEYYDPNEKGE